MSVLLVDVARADDQTATARAHYNAGEALFQLGRYREALEEFAAGYRISNLPEFIIDIGQTYRKLGDLAAARDVYAKYLAKTDATAPYRTEVRKLLGEVVQQLGASTFPTERAPTKPTAIFDTTRPPDPVPTTPALELTQAAPVTPPAHRSFMRRHWWIVPVSVVAIAGLSVGIYFGVTAGRFDCGSVSLGCVKASPR